MAKDQVIVEDVVNSAIIEGFNSGLQVFLEDINAELERDAVIRENGSAHDIFQAMISENITEPAGDFEELQERMKKLK